MARHVKRMRLSDWAVSQGLKPKDAWWRLHRGTLPRDLNPVQIGRKWFVEVVSAQSRLHRIAYARVSSADQRDDLVRQKLRLLEHAQKSSWMLDDIVTEVGSGLNGTRRRLLKILADPGLGWLVVEHRDRLARFGFEMVDALLQARGGGVIVLEDQEVDDDLVRDMTEVLTSLCARLYGRRSAKRRAERAVEAAGQ